MENCKKCIFYNKAYDDLRRRADDKILIGAEQKDRHFCIVYEDGIPEDIASDLLDCRRHENKPI